MLVVEGVSKTYPGGVEANKDVNLRLRRGEVLALLGENGAGKTTLVSIIAGQIAPDRGRIVVEGEELKPKSVQEAVRRGVVLVPQHPRLVESYTVIENIGLFLWANLAGRKKRDLEEELEEIMSYTGLRVDLYKRVRDLSFGERQKAEILKALAARPKVLLLDEATTHMPPLEVEYFIKLVRRLASRGMGIVFITHKLEEAIRVSDTIAVMRRGRIVAVLDSKTASREKLLEYMFGERIASTTSNCYTRVVETSGESPVLVVENLAVRDDYGREAVAGVSLSVWRGEIVGVAGIAGNGQRELFEALVGIRRPTAGRIIIGGDDVTRKPPSKRLKKRIAVIPEERLGWGLVPGRDLVFNTVFPLLSRLNGEKRLLVDWRKWEKTAMKIIEDYQVKAKSVKSMVEELSGGNMQRLVVGRELDHTNPILVLAMNPTSGLDAKTAIEVREKFRRAVSRNNTGILVFSEDLDELVQIAGRILVMSRGRITGEFTPPYNTREIGRAMTL